MVAKVGLAPTKIPLLRRQAVLFAINPQGHNLKFYFVWVKFNLPRAPHWTNRNVGTVDVGDSPKLVCPVLQVKQWD
jgi:hypothetical protein